MAIFRWRDPFEEHFREFSRLQEEIDRLYERFFGKRPYTLKGGVFPAVNVYEDDANLYVCAELPGVEPQDLDITVEDERLTLRGAQETMNETETLRYRRREREGGPFHRTVSLPARVDPEKAHAEAKDGVLMVTLPKAGVMESKKVEIRVD